MTIKEIKQIDDIAFAARILRERLNKLGNPNTPMAAKLRCSIRALENVVERKTSNRCNWWEITYTDDVGRSRYARDMQESELMRIGMLVERGFYCGEILTDDDDSQHASDVADCLGVIDGMDEAAVQNEYGVSVQAFKELADKMGYAMRRNIDKYHMDVDDALDNAITDVLDICKGGMAL